MSEIKQRIQCTGDDGNHYEVLVIVDQINTSNLSGRSSIDGLPALRTSDGKTVTPLEKGKYRIVQTGVVLTSSDPKAL